MLLMLGEFGITAGSGMDGAGEADRRIDGDDMAPKDDRRLCDVGGGCIAGRARDCGVPGIEGTGEPMPRVESVAKEARAPKSGGAGLFEDMRRAGRSIFVTLLWGSSANWPSLVFSV
jgi:hypothetical protein